MKDISIRSGAIYITLVFAFLPGCRDDSLSTIDQDLYSMAKVTDGFTWYKNSPALLDRSNASGHSMPFLRTRFNDVAAQKLDGSGKVVAGSVFPAGALIVKELYKDANTLEMYAILYKDPASDYADAKGWVWGYLYKDGRVAASAEEKGSSCISCHQQSGNIDYSLMNKYFP